jgi:opacity protein-like surface antigen
MNARNSLFAAVAVALCVLTPRGAEAQGTPWSVEGRLGSTIPTGDLSDDALNQTAGMSFGADLMYTLNPNFTVFGGVGHHRFNCDGCETDVSSTGVDGGLKLLVGADGRAMPWLRAGLLVHQPKIEDAEGDWNAGLDSGVGIDWLVTDEFTLVPALRYNTYGTESVTLSYFTIDLGGHLHFGG